MATEVPEEDRTEPAERDLPGEELPAEADPADAFEQRLPGAESEPEPLAEEPIGERLDDAAEADVLEQAIGVPEDDEEPL